MPDNLKKRGPADRKRISLKQRWEVTYWRKRLGCTARQLRAAVKAVGPMVTKVRAELKRRRSRLAAWRRYF
jgi:hypothetical protein